MKKIIIILLLIGELFSAVAQVPLNNTILRSKNLNSLEMQSIGNPLDGSILYNTQDTSIFLRSNSNKWMRLRQELKVCNQYLNISDGNGVELSSVLARRKGETLSWTGNKWKSDSLLSIFGYTESFRFLTECFTPLFTDNYVFIPGIEEDGTNKLAYFDIQDPDELKPMGYIKNNDDACLRNVRDVAWHNNILYLGGDKLTAIDLDDFYDWPETVLDSGWQQFEQQWIYWDAMPETGGCNPLFTIDLPTAPYENENNIVKMTIKDNRWLICFRYGGGLYSLFMTIYDLNNPLNPQLVMDYQFEPNSSSYMDFFDIEIQGDRIFFSSHGTEIRYFDLPNWMITSTQPQNINLNSIQCAPYLNWGEKKMMLHNNANIMMVSWTQLTSGGSETDFAIYNISNPTNPILIATLPHNAMTFDIDEAANRLYIPDKASGLLYVYDITVPGNPVQVDIISNEFLSQPGLAMWGGIKVRDGRCYFHDNFFMNSIPLEKEGSVGIGETNPEEILEVNGQANKLNGGNWTGYSDKRIKKNINPLTYGLKEISQINTVEYQYNSLSGFQDTTKTYVGVLAQDIQKILPHTVSQKRNSLNGLKDVKQLDSSSIMWILLNAIKELKQQIEDEKKYHH
ncbi:MAG: tail fiber domain-containing protein [Flavobacteriales bacterium]|nr:tail fiber domain-containing protein [Flavobacteriales bacterium]